MLPAREGELPWLGNVSTESVREYVDQPLVNIGLVHGRLHAQEGALPSLRLDGGSKCSRRLMVTIARGWKNHRLQLPQCQNAHFSFTPIAAPRPPLVASSRRDRHEAVAQLRWLGVGLIGGGGSGGAAALVGGGDSSASSRGLPLRREKRGRGTTPLAWCGAT